jgi:hypothetical protein
MIKSKQNYLNGNKSAIINLRKDSYLLIFLDALSVYLLI